MPQTNAPALLLSRRNGDGAMTMGTADATGLAVLGGDAVRTKTGPASSSRRAIKEVDASFRPLALPAGFHSRDKRMRIQRPWQGSLEVLQPAQGILIDAV